MSGKNNPNKSLCDFDKFTTYNELSKEYNLKSILVEELFSLSKVERNKFYITIMDKKTKTPTPPKPPRWFSYWCETEFKSLKNDVTQLKQDVAVLKKEMVEVKQDILKINTRLDNIVKLNNLKE